MKIKYRQVTEIWNFQNVCPDFFSFWKDLYISKKHFSLQTDIVTFLHIADRLLIINMRR